MTAEPPAMQRPPPLSSFGQFPITTGVAVLAIVATLRWWAGGDVERFVMSYQAWTTQPWRLVTSTLFHGDIIHLLFNLCWIWVFGTQFERVYGPHKTLGAFLLLGVGSGVAEYALFRGGVGLSGVGYGLFGFFWVTSKRDPRFAGVVDKGTTQLFVGWFFLCVVLTIANVWHIGNVAHGVGALLGALLGWAVSARSSNQRTGYAGLLAGTTALIMVAGAFGRPYINLADAAGNDIEEAGLAALKDADYQRAIELYQRAIAINDKAGSWNNLGVAYERLGRISDSLNAYRRATELNPFQPLYWRNLGSIYQKLGNFDDALDAYRRAAKLAPSEKEYQTPFTELAVHLARASIWGNRQRALKLYRQVVEIDDSDPEVWDQLGAVCEATGHAEEAQKAFAKAAALRKKSEPPEERDE